MTPVIPQVAPLVVCRGVSKRFYHYEHRTTSLQEYVTRKLRGQPVHVRKPRFSLTGLDLTIAPGESVALIGANGSGKSTALRLLAGIYPPTEGTIVTRGRVVAVIELGATFQPELTGLENIELYGVALGMTRRQVRETRDSVLSFAGVDDFADVPLKYYSSGMRSRLGFSIAVHTSPDVLMLDEVLAVGDAEFRTRCLERLASFRADGGSLVIVSHDLEALPSLVTHAVWLDHGRTRMTGDIEEVMSAYLAMAEES